VGGFGHLWHLMARLVPWSSWDEWLMVKQLLFPSSGDPHANVASRRRGIELVDAWRLRGKVPLAVDATSSLLDAMDEQKGITSLSSLSSSSSEYGLRLKLALPIIKLVNGVSDSQQRGRTASSVAVLASVAGLPRVLVDIRHDASHKELPTLSMLMLGARQALGWLEDSYWSSQLTQLLKIRERIRETFGQLLASCSQAAIATDPSLIEEEEEKEEEEEGNEIEATKQNHKGKEGNKYRKALVSSLRSLVPISWSQYIVDALLDPPSSSAQSLSHDKQGEEEEVTALLPPHAEATASDKEGFTAAMRLMSKSYPSIGNLIVSSAVRRLVRRGPSWTRSVWASQGQQEECDYGTDKWLCWLHYALDQTWLLHSNDNQEINTVIHMLLDPLMNPPPSKSDQSDRVAEGCCKALTRIKELKEGRESLDALMIALIDSAVTAWGASKSHEKDLGEMQAAPETSTAVASEGTQGKCPQGRWRRVEEGSWNSCPIGRMTDPLSHYGRPCEMVSSHKGSQATVKASQTTIHVPSRPSRPNTEIAPQGQKDSEPQAKPPKPSAGLKRKSAQLLL
jgi:hypothetical protein